MPHTEYYFYFLGPIIFTLIRIELNHAQQTPIPLIPLQREGGQNVLIEGKWLGLQNYCLLLKKCLVES